MREDELARGRRKISLRSAKAENREGFRTLHAGRRRGDLGWTVLRAALLLFHQHGEQTRAGTRTHTRRRTQSNFIHNCSVCARNKKNYETNPERTDNREQSHHWLKGESSEQLLLQFLQRNPANQLLGTLRAELLELILSLSVTRLSWAADRSANCSWLRLWGGREQKRRK